MKVKIKISKKLIFRLAAVVVIISGAFIIDTYLDHNPVNLDEAHSATGQPAHDQGAFVLYTSVNTLNIRPIVQKAPVRFLQTKMHDKFLQKYHQLRNFHVLKAEFRKPKVPLVLSYHFIIFRDYYSSFPDDEPFLT